ncbi:MFS transporter, partial [Jiangella rhizosphaerae]
ADRVGQRPVVLAQSLTAGVALAALVAAVHAGADTPVLVGAAAVAGFTMPQVGPLARVRWRPITHRTGSAQPRLVDAAFSYEGAADEASFVLGPALVGLGAVALSPSGALLAAAALLVVFGSWFALHSTAQLTHALRASAAAHGESFVTVAFLTLCLAQLLIGVIFGATQTGTTALATAAGTPGLAGLVHSLLGVGSVLAGLATAALPARFGYDRRILVFAIGLVVLSSPLLLAGSLTALVPVVLVLGLAVAPYMISVFAAAERQVPVTRVGAAMTLLAGATGIGYAVGSGIAGRLADLGGHRPAFAVTVTAAALAVVLAVVRLRTQRPAAPVTTPGELAAASQG